MPTKPKADNELDLVGPGAQTLYEATTELQGDLLEKEIASFDAPEADDDYERRKRDGLLAREFAQIDSVLAARDKYAKQVFKLVVWWLVGVGVTILLQGFKIGFALSDSVLLALIGGTTLNVIGIFTIVANFLFPKSGFALFAAIKSGRKQSKNKNPILPRKSRAPTSKSRSTD